MEKFDFIDAVILSRIYKRPQSLPILYSKLRTSGIIVSREGGLLGIEALRKRLHRLVSLGFLKKSSSNNPKIYSCIEDKKGEVEILINFYKKAFDEPIGGPAGTRTRSL